MAARSSNASLVAERQRPAPGVAASAALASVNADLRDRLQLFFEPFNRKLSLFCGIKWSYNYSTLTPTIPVENDNEAFLEYNFGSESDGYT